MTLSIPIDVLDDEGITTVTYEVDAWLEGTARWLHVGAIKPEPASPFVEEQILAIAERKLNDAIEAALDAAMYDWRG